MDLHGIFQWFENWPLSDGIRTSSWMFPTIESVHVIAIVLVVGSVMVVDLRVLGLASKRRPVNQLSWEILPWTWGCFVIAVVTGLLLFAAKAEAYWADTPFRLKMLLIALAGVNMLFFHFVPYRSVAQWDRGNAPILAKVSCGLSLCFWILVIAMGRMIGYTIQG